MKGKDENIKMKYVNTLKNILKLTNALNCIVTIQHSIA